MADQGTASGGGGRAGSAFRFAEGGNPLLALYREVNRTFDEFLRGIDLPMFGRGGSGEWPHVDVTETEREVRVIAELPGVEEKDVEVTLQDGVLTLQGEKRAEGEGGTVRRERWFGAFRRAIQLGPDVDPERVSASFRNGVLTVTLGKREKERGPAKRIPIGGSDAPGGPGKGS